ncbi:MAG: cutinase family protein [Mycobacteriaceae bacterium]|nr:cutinase family protein [Mycobacteriaceae bacterium]MBV9638266.1 cutinase family protein [Mycobacteriaceae bacterium]
MNVIKVIHPSWARRLLVVVSGRQTACFLGAAVVTTCAALLGAPIPAASAQPCPDVEVVFARGTGETPGVGGVGQAFVDSLTSKVGARSVGVYAVNYAASSDFAGGLDFARTVVDGIRDAGAHVESTAANCPNTRIVLGGYSQGAVVAGFATSAAVPKEVPAAYISYVPKPMPSQVADHVAAVALLGKPSDQFMREYGVPPITIGPLYAAKTIELCVPDDTICNGAAGGGPTIAHALYAVNGMAGQAADFAASRL